MIAEEYQAVSINLPMPRRHAAASSSSSIHFHYSTRRYLQHRHPYAQIGTYLARRSIRSVESAMVELQIGSIDGGSIDEKVMSESVTNDAPY